MLLAVGVMHGCGGGGGGGSTDSPANTSASPVANAGSNQGVLTARTVKLDGTASSSATGSSLSYQWSFASLPAGSTALLSGATTGKPTFVPDKDGTYVVQLKVSNGTAESTANVTVTAFTPPYTQLAFRGFVIPNFTLRTTEKLNTSLQEAISIGTNAVIFDYYFYLIDGNSGSNITLNPYQPLSVIASAVQKAKSLGLQVWVKPILMVGTPSNSSIIWQNISPADVDAWFASYLARLLELAQVAQQNGVSVLLIGNELASMSMNQSYRQQWLNLITTVRAQFTGKIGYEAGALLGPWTASQEYRNVAFLDALDLIGLSAYPRLSEDVNVSLQGQIDGWYSNAYQQNLVTELKSFLSVAGRDVYFTELGSPAVPGGNWTGLGGTGSVVYDVNQQADFFDASLRVITQEFGSNIKGVFVYNWHANAGETFGFVPRNTWNDAYFWNIYGKPAEAPIKKWFIGNGN